MTDELEKLVEDAPLSSETIEAQMMATYREMEEAEGEATESGDEGVDVVDDPEADETEEEAGNEPQEAQAQAAEDKKPHKKRRTTVDFTTPVEPPRDWSAEAKEWFKKQPKEYQSETKRVADQFQKWRTTKISEFQRERQAFEAERQNFQGMTQVVSRFLPRWAARGLTPEAAISQFCAFEELVQKDPEKAILGLANAKGIKITIQNGKSSENRGDTTPPVSYDHIYSRVKQDLDQERAQYERTHQVRTLTQEISGVVKALQDESNDQGNYVYPDLHSEEFQAQLEPLASGLARTNPGLGWREILLRSYKAAGGRVFPSRKSGFAANLTNSRRQELQKRAASSVAGSASRDLSGSDPRPGESTEDTVRRIYAQLNTR